VGLLLAVVAVSPRLSFAGPGSALAAMEKHITIVLNKTQLQMVNGKLAAMEIVLDAGQLKSVRKTWKDFKGTAATVVKAFVFQKDKVKLTLVEGHLVSIDPALGDL